MKNILLLGSGGRECALAWKIAQSPHCAQLFIAPGNAGTLNYGTNLPISNNNFEDIKKACIQFNIDMLFIGPEEPLVNGIVDFFYNDEELKHILVVGPKKAGAELEGSKAFSKAFMLRHNIPTATYKEFDITNYDEGIAYIAKTTPPYVIKADGLAAGKGVVITLNKEEAQSAFHSMIKEAQFGAAGKKVVIEQYLTGIELSMFVLTDGTNYLLLPEAKDYKRIGEGDLGPNTGGMGAISPVPFADQDFKKKVIQQIIEPTIQGLKKEQISYIGFLFIGLMNVEGNPYVIEYNCRLGDPETEVIIPRIENDLIALILAMEAGNLNDIELKINPKTAATVMMVAGGYPGSYERGVIISGLEAQTDCIIFHAGTKITENNIVTNGGRVLAITAIGENYKNSLAAIYNCIETIKFDKKYFRKDIGWEFL